MLNFKEIRVGTTNLETDLYDWLEANIADWEELSNGSRRRFISNIEDQLELAAEDGKEIQIAEVIYSYNQFYTCLVDLRSHLAS